MLSFNLLPNEILLEIFEILINYTSYKYVSFLKIVCKRWNTLMQLVIQTTLSKKIIKNLRLEVIVSKYPIKSVKFSDDINIYFGNSFTLQGEYCFILFTSQKLVEDFQHVQICFKYKNPSNIGFLNEHIPKYNKEFNKFWTISIKEKSKYYKLNLIFKELLYYEGLTFGDRYARINLNKLLWLIETD